MIGCKAFATRESQLTPPGYADAPLLNPYQFVDCRGVVMLGCSAAFAGDHCIRVEAKDRQVEGFLITGCTFESSPGGLLETVGGAALLIQNISLRQNRLEGTVGPISLDYTEYSLIESANLTVTISANCQQLHIYTEDFTKITDGGLYTNIFGYGNAINSSFVLYPAMDVLAQSNPSIEYGIVGNADRWLMQYAKTSSTDNGFKIQKNGVDVMILGADQSIYSAGAESLRVSYPFGVNQAGMLLAVNNGTVTMKRVEIGAADSGGVGFRMLRVTN